MLWFREWASRKSRVIGWGLVRFGWWDSCKWIFSSRTCMSFVECFIYNVTIYFPLAALEVLGASDSANWMVFIMDVCSEGVEGWLRCGRMGTRGRGFDCMRTSATQHRCKACRAGVQLHSDSYHPTVTAVSLLNAPLKSLDICLWLLGLWHRAHASVRGEAATSHPSLRTHWPTHCFATGCMQLLQHSLSLEWVL